jgi:hypothetical protein
VALSLASSSAATSGREIRRMSALRSATIFYGDRAEVHKATNTDVLNIADACLAWLERRN